MTMEQLALVACGVLMNGLVFAIGVAVGITLRKDSDHDSDTDEAPQAGGNWHLPLDIGAPHSPQLRGASGAKPKPEADSAKRAPL